MITDINTFRDLIEKLDERGDRVAFRERRNDEFEEITYGEMAGWTKAISAFLSYRGIKKPDRVAIISKNRMEWGISYMGITYGGCIAVPIDPELKENEIVHILKFSEAKALFTEERFLQTVEEILPRVDIELVITMDGSGDLSFYEVVGEGLDLIGKEGEEEVKFLGQHTASIIFTSGTTGVSKAVELSHQNFIFDTIQSEKLLNISENDIFLSVLPIHHTFEFTGGFLDPIFAGASIVYVRSLKSKELLEDLKDSQATMLLGVPLLFEKLYQGITRELSKQGILKKGIVNMGLSLGNLARRMKRKPSRNLITGKILEQAGLDSLRVVIAGGAPLDSEVEVGLKALGLNIIQGYGLTEASPIVTINPIDNPKSGSIGLPIPGISLKIVDPNEEGVGEIVVKGDNVMKGYYKNPEATAEVLKDEWLYTGDMGYMDEEGYVYITGRKKSVIVTGGGKNIYPEEIEHLLKRSDYIEEVLVTELFNKEKDRIELTAIIYPNWEELDEYIESRDEDETVIREILKDEVNKVNEKLASYKRVISFELREEEFPKTTTRKIKRYLFEERRIQVDEKP